jgi:hypothetical protein
LTPARHTLLTARIISEKSSQTQLNSLQLWIGSLSDQAPAPMCHREGNSSVGGEGVDGSAECELKNHENNNRGSHHHNQQQGAMAGGFLASQGWADPRPTCSCMSGDRRIRRRHPATVQTPGRSLNEGDLMEPLVSNRLTGERVSFEPVRDFNDNFSCDQEKFYDVQFAMDFSHLRTTPSPQRFGGLDESARSGGEKRNKNRILSSTLK